MVGRCIIVSGRGTLDWSLYICRYVYVFTHCSCPLGEAFVHYAFISGIFFSLSVILALIFIFVEQVRTIIALNWIMTILIVSTFRSYVFCVAYIHICMYLDLSDGICNCGSICAVPPIGLARTTLMVFDMSPCVLHCHTSGFGSAGKWLYLLYFSEFTF